MRPEMRQLKGALLFVILNLAISLVFLSVVRLPEVVPLSWWDGEPLVLGSRWALLFRTPAVMVALLAAIVVGLRWDRTLTGRRRAEALGPILVLMLAVMTYGHLRLLFLAATGATHAVPAVGDVAVVGLCLAGLGNYLAKTQSNGFYAFTFPWLRGNEQAFLRTQRTAAWLFVGVGALIVLASPLLVGLSSVALAALTPVAALAIAVIVTTASWAYARSANALDRSV